MAGGEKASERVMASTANARNAKARNIAGGAAKKKKKVGAPRGKGRKVEEEDDGEGEGAGEEGMDVG